MTQVMGPKTYGKLERLQAKHLKIAELALQGRPAVWIAKELEMSQGCIYNILNAPIFKAELARRREERNVRQDEAAQVSEFQAKDILDSHASLAAETQVGLLSANNDRIRQIAAMDILDRTGHPKITRQDSRQLKAVVVLNAAAVQRLQETTELCFGKGKGLDFESEGVEFEREDGSRVSARHTGRESEKAKL